MKQHYAKSDIINGKLQRDVNTYRAEMLVNKQKADKLQESVEVRAKKERQLNTLVDSLKREVRLQKGYKDKANRRLDQS